MKILPYGLLLSGFLVLACAGAPPRPAASIYNEQADAHRDIAAAIANAGAGNKNIVLIFGANW